MTGTGFVLGIVSFVMPFFIFSFLIGSVVDSGGARISSSSSRIPHFHLSGLLVEGPRQASLSFSGGDVGSLKHLVRNISRAKDDDTVEAIVFTFDQSAMGIAQTEEVWRAMQDFKESGKKVYAHAESLSTGTSILLSAASHLNVVPTGSVMLTGLYSESLYLKDVLDNIGVQADIVHIGEYKSAGEMFTRTGPSDPAKWNANEMFDSLYGSEARMIADAKGMTPEEVKNLFDGGPYTLDGARAAGFVDSTMHLDEFLDMITEEYGEEMEVDNYYGVDLGPQIDIGGPFGMLALFSKLSKAPDIPSEDAVAIVYIEGAIVSGHNRGSAFGTLAGAYSGDIRKYLEWAEEDDSIRAVVLRVDSPGGSATASEIILRAVQKLKDKKPVVVSMGNVAASGGYYVSCDADAIFANATTITGSIGVVGGKIVTDDLWDELGIHWYPYKRGENADLFASREPFRKDQREKIVEMMEEVYGVFKDHVVNGRDEKLTEPIDALAGGRVFTGEQALEAGLIDEIGGIQEAIEYAAEQAGLEDYEVRNLPEPMDFFEQMMLQFSGLGERASDLHAQARSAGGMQQLRRSPMSMSRERVSPLAATARALEPQRTEAVFRMIKALELLRNESVIAMMPELFVFR